MKKIALSKQGKNRGKYFTLVDDEDFDYLNKFNWTYQKKGVSRMVKLNNKWNNIKLHRLLIQPNKNQQVDHIDRNPLNNQKNNLRVCSASQNSMNTSIRSDNTSGFKCVSLDKRTNRWGTFITVNKKIKWLGYFDDKKEAAKVYNKNALEYFGEFANLNKI